MTDLTDKWEKGELIEGKKYYCESKYIADMFKAECHNKGQNDEYWTLKNGKYCFNNVYHKNDIKVLAPVPSYEEWQEKIEENIKLKTENKWYSEQLNEAVKKSINSKNGRKSKQTVKP